MARFPRSLLQSEGVRALGLLLLLCALGAAAAAATRADDFRRDLRADQAWQVRRGDVLRQDGRGDLAQARARYLEGDLAAALDLLRHDDSEAADEVRNRVEEALAVDTPWPGMVPRHRRLALRGEETDLARVVQDGEDRFLEVQGFRGDRYGRLPLEILDPGGEPLRKDRVERVPLGQVVRFDSGRLTGAPNLLVGHRRDGQELLDVVVGTGERLRLFRFTARSAPRIDGRQVSVESEGEQDRERWRWEGDRFVR